MLAYRNKPTTLKVPPTLPLDGQQQSTHLVRSTGYSARFGPKFRPPAEAASGGWEKIQILRPPN
jgi:hypothetical protein